MKQTTQEELINLWLVPYHGLTVAELIAKEPREVLESPQWFKKYAVTQQQHDEWYEAAINLLCKRTGLSKKSVRRAFAFDYLNCAPSIIETQ